MIKKIFSIFTAVLMVIAVMAISSGAEIEYQQVDRPYPNSLLILGDSIASGYGLEGYTAGDNNSAANYGSMLKAQYGLTNDTYRNFAVDGQTSELLLEKLEDGTYDNYLISEVVVISIGGNDLLGVMLDESSEIFSKSNLQGMFTGEITADEFFQSLDLNGLAEEISAMAEENIELFSENLTGIISYIKSKNPECQIVLQTLYNPMNSGIDVIDQLYSDNIKKINDVINSADNCVKADVYSLFEASDGSLIQRDFTHPNADGHKLIYQAVSECINKDCQFFNTIEIEKTTVEVRTEKTHIKKYIAAIFAFAALAVFAVLVGIILRIFKKRKTN